MKLQKISILVIVSLLIIFLLVISVFFSSLLLASYRDLEERYMEKDLSQAVSVLNDELNTLSSYASDWGPWDDTVDFVRGNDPDYFNSNLQPSTFDNLKLNLMVFTNARGEVIYAGSYNLLSNLMVPVPAFFSKNLDPTDPLMNMSDSHYVTKGVMMLPEGPLLVVSQPIVDSGYSIPAQGVVIMGRYLNKEEISKLAASTMPSLTFIPTGDPSFSPELVSRIRDKDGQAPWLVMVQNPDLIAGYALIPDIYGNDALILRVDRTRDIYHQGLHTTVQVLLIILVGGLFLGLGVIILQDRVIIRRISSLVFQVKTIGKSAETMEYVEMNGDDELSGLAEEINRMLKTIEQTQQKVQESEAQFRDLVENLPDYIIVYGKNGEILYVNPAAVRALGYDADTMMGTSVISYVATEFREIVRSKITERHESDGIPTYEIDILGREGLRRSVIVKGTKIRFHDVPATFLLLIDITPRKELEKEREYQAKELERYSHSLHEANAKLRLLTGLTRHDIQNKLIVMQSFHLLAIEESDISLSHEYISHAHQAGCQMEAIIGFTREYESFGVVSSGWKRIYQIIESAMIEVPLNEVTVENQIPHNLEIYADPIIRKVFTTLMENSVRHGEGITHIRFSCFVLGNLLSIICEDDGVGVPSSEKEYIFNHGYGKHTGIGLFLTREILSITGLSIRECGEPGEGARFEITVPEGGFRWDTKES
jgi:PAS domain S-box-containing protein